MHGSTPPHDEDDLCRRCAAGDEAAFSEVYRRFGGTLYGTAWRILKSPPEAEEVVQEAFLTLYRKAGGDQPPRHLGAWLRRVTANRALDRLRRRTRRGEIALVDEGQAAPSGSGVAATPAHDAPGTVRTGARLPDGLGIDIQRAIEQLPQRTRMVFILHDVEGFKHREIGELMGISDGSSKSALFRARATLRQWLQEGTPQ